MIRRHRRPVDGGASVLVDHWYSHAGTFEDLDRLYL
jgi:hypothetical protein